MAALAIVLTSASIIAPLFATLSPTKGFAVATGSMEPNIPKGSLVITHQADPVLGDVIVYEAPNGENQIHRVVDVRTSVDGPSYRTQGDANPQADSFTVKRDWVLGVVHNHVPYLGYLWLMPLWIQALLFFASILTYVGIVAWDDRHVIAKKWRSIGLLAIVFVTFAPTALGAVDLQQSPGSDHDLATLTARTPLSAGDMGTATIDADEASATVNLETPQLWKEVALYACEAAASCSVTPPTSYSTSTLPGTITRVNMARFDPDPTVYFEAYLTAPSAGNSISAILFNRNTSATVALSEVTTTSTTATLVRSGAFTLSGDAHYMVETKKTGGSGGSFHQAKLVFAQTVPTATETLVRVANAGTENLGLAFLPTARTYRWTYDAAAFDGVESAYFEAVANRDTLNLAGTARLVDRSDSDDVVASLSFTTTTPTLSRAPIDLADLVDGHEYEVELKAGILALTVSPITLHSARVGIIQSGFTTSGRYVDLSAQATTTSTSLTAVGYDARYETTSEWGDRTGYFEANLLGQALGVTATADLYDDTLGASIASSSVSTTGTTLSIQRSGLLTLSADDTRYATRLSSSSALTAAEIRVAWLIVFQTADKGYDHVLAADHDVVNACTWDYVLEYVSSTNLARLDDVTIKLRGDSGTEDQVVIASGVVTQASGTSMDIAFGNTLEVVVDYSPSSAGSSTVTTDLVATCATAGLHMRMPVEFELD